MKTKALLLIAISAIITLSFTFGSGKTTEKQKIEINKTNSSAAPAGGIISEDQI